MRKQTKTEHITVRLTKWEYEQLQSALKITGQNRNIFIENAILEKAQNITKYIKAK